MSIDRISKLLQNKGCNVVVSAVLGISVISFIGFRGCGSQENPEDRRDQGVPVVSVGDVKVTSDMVKNGADRQLDQYKQFMEMLPESFKLKQGEGAVLNMFVANGLALKLAKEQGIDLSDELIKQKIMQGQMDNYRAQLEQNLKLRPNATEQELENAFKTATGGKQTLAGARREIEKQLNEQLDTPDGRVLLQSSEAFPLLVEKNKSKFLPSEEAIKEQFFTYRLKVIDLDKAKAGKEDIKKKADRIQKEIKSGLSFEAAMDKYSDTAADKGKKKSDRILDEPKSSLENNPQLKPLMSLKPGQASDVILNPNGASLYKLVSAGIQLPKDFETQKASLMDARARADAQKALMEQIRKLDTPENVKWANEGYHVLHDFLSIPDADPERPKKMKAIVERALKAQGEVIGADIAAGTAMSALAEATTGMPPLEAAKLRVPVLVAYVQHYPEIDAKLELAEAYIAAGDAENTAPTLHDIADVNLINLNPQGKQIWERLHKDIKLAQTKSLLKTEDVKALDEFYARWQKDFADQQAADKEAAAEQKKRDDELKKESAPAPSGTTTGGTTPPAPKGKPGKAGPEKKKPVGKP